MNANTTETFKYRNPYISKWNILFEKEGKQWLSVKPHEGAEAYACYACRELFTAKTSFLDHVNRFTIVLSFKCDACSPPEELQFYNPCALLLHSRQHYSAFGGQISLDDIKVSCLPYGLAGFPPHPDIPMIYDVKEDDDANGANINTRFYAPNRLNKGKNLVMMLPTILLFYHYKFIGAPAPSLVLKQICSNIPKCVFTRLETSSVCPNVVNPITEKRITHNEEHVTINGNPLSFQKNPLCPVEVSETNHIVIINNNNTDNNIVKTSNLDVINNGTTNENGAEIVNDVNSHSARLESLENLTNNAAEETRQCTNSQEAIVEKGIEQIRIKEESPEKENAEIPAENPLAILTPSSECPECKVQFPDTKFMLHFSGLNPLSDEYQCDMCKYIAASPCSFHAHKRLHAREPPFVCPECGKVFELNIDLLNHIEDVCFHLAKQVRLRCPKKNCCKVFAQLTTFMIHFEVHIQTLNKCTVCNATFYAIRDHVEHCESEHLKPVPSEVIYKCTICRHSTLHADHYSQHVQWHCKNESLRVYVYICKFCRNFFRSGTTYASHLLRCNKKELTIEEMRRLKKSNAAVVCLHCNYVIRLITKLEDCPRCGKAVNESSIKPFLSKRPLENSILPRTIKCILCFEDLVFNEAKLHECKYKYPIVLLDRDDENIQKILSIKRETQETRSRSEFGAKKKRRKSSISPIHLKHKRSSAHGDGAEPHLDEPVPFEGTYTCKLCEYKDNDRTLFHEHIKDHRSVSTSYQCMECGECFVVKPSFHKHLLYYHKIVNVDEYVRENKCVDESAISELKKHMRIESGEINDDVAENQCKVCLKQFRHPLELNQHFRMHGMAFLRNNK